MLISMENSLLPPTPKTPHTPRIPKSPIAPGLKLTFGEQWCKDEGFRSEEDLKKAILAHAAKNMNKSTLSSPASSPTIE